MADETVENEPYSGCTSIPQTDANVFKVIDLITPAHHSVITIVGYEINLHH